MLWLIMPLLIMQHFKEQQYHKAMLLENRIMHQSLSFMSSMAQLQRIAHFSCSLGIKSGLSMDRAVGYCSTLTSLQASSTRVIYCSFCKTDTVLLKIIFFLCMSGIIPATKINPALPVISFQGVSDL